MPDIQKRIQELKTRWEKVYDAVQQNTQLWEQHYPELTPDEVNYIVGTVIRLFDRTRAPSGFSAGYEAAKASALASMPNIDSQLDQIVAQRYNHIGNFVNQINQLLAASLTLFITGSTGEEGRQLASIASEVAESAERAERATKNLEANALELKARDEEILKREKRLDNLDERSTTLEDIISNLKATQAEVAEFRDSAENASIESERSAEALDKRQDATKSLEQEALNANATLSKLVEEAESIRYKMERLLPGAASVGLAASFEERAKKLELPKIGWMSLFVFSIAGMLVVAFTIDFGGEDYLKDALTRLPFLAPLVWLGWFSALQYGNTIRLEEDYRFKTSTAKAFVGYRDHMEHLKDVDLENADNALALISAKTIEVLSIEPGRLLGKSHNETSPSGGVFGLASKRKSKDANES